MNIQLSLLSALGALLFSFSSIKNTDLTDISKPYLGEYPCKIAKLGSEDYLSQFSELVLELKLNGEYELRYKLKNGMRGKDTGKYTYDKQKETLRITKGGKEEWKRDIPIKNGTISIAITLGEKLLYLQFQQK